MADSLPVLPYDVLLIIAKMYRVATVEMRFDMGWWQVHRELMYLPRCPARKRLIPTGGFLVPLNNPRKRTKPVTGYFYRQMVKAMLRATDPKRLEWFSRFFRKDDKLKPGESPEWVIIFCKHCRDDHLPWGKAEQEEREWQAEQRVYRKNIRRLAQLKARRDWLKRLRPR